MVKWTARVGVLLVVLVMAAAPALAKKRKGPIEHGTWNVRITPDAAAAARGEKATQDTLVLRQGFFRSKGSDQYGFSGAGYTIHDNAFKVETASRQNGKIHWSGLIDGDSIAGRMVWTMKDGTVLTYTFSGTRASEEPWKRKK